MKKCNMGHMHAEEKMLKHEKAEVKHLEKEMHHKKEHHKKHKKGK